MIVDTSDFIAKAREFEDKGMLDSALLYYVIALDLLLSDGKASGLSIRRRGAALLSKGQRGKYIDFRNKLKQAYSARSSYVHEGQMEKDALHFLQVQVPKILECLLRIYSNPKWHSDEFRALWFQELDFIAASLESGRTPSREDLEALGIDEPSSFARQGKAG